MAKSISCADAGADCGWSATARTERELLEMTAEHVKKSHKELKMGPELAAKIKSLMKDI